MAVRLILTINLQPGRAEEYATAFAGLAASVTQEPGCEQYELFRSTQDPDKVVLLERWTDADALAVHMTVLRARGPLPTAGFSAGPASMERFEV